MNFLQQIFVQLVRDGDAPALREGRVVTTARELNGLAAGARAFARRAGLRRGDRVVLIGENSARWIALDMGLMAEGLVVVPLYARQAPAELAAMIRDCEPSLVLCDRAPLLEAVEAAAPDAKGLALFEEAFVEAAPAEPVDLDPADTVRIIYTSGTSGAAKGVRLTLANIDFMLPRTRAKIDLLMRGHRGAERVFHYLPCCFAGSWILLQSCLLRGSHLTLCTDLQKLGEELRTTDPHYVLNVPLLLERMRSGIEEVVRQRGGLTQKLWRKRWLARWLLYPAVRRQIAPSLRALICGSAPLAEETQRFYIMLGLPVLQVYGLTETTAICTMDTPGEAVPGRVGRAVEGCEMRRSEEGEILVRGPHLFPGYWGRPPREGEWLATGDLGEVDERGLWRIIGRKKFLLVLASGHNVPPEPLEERLRLAVAGATHVVVLGDGRKFLTAIVAGAGVQAAHVERAVAALNEELPHYRRVRAFHVHGEPFGPDQGLLTANGKLKRDAIAERFRAEIDRMYA